MRSKIIGAIVTVVVLTSLTIFAWEAKLGHQQQSGIPASGFLGQQNHATENTASSSLASLIPGSQTTLAQSTSSSEPDISSWVIYHNAKYGYSFKYPPDYSLLRDLDIFQVIGTVSSGTGQTSGQYWVEVNVSGDPSWKRFSSESDFISAALEDLSGRCEASGLNGQEIATDAIDISTSTNQDGVLYYTAYFQYTHQSIDPLSGKVMSKAIGIIGPFYALDIETETGGSARLLAVFPGGPSSCLATSAPQPESPLIQAFIQNISF